MSLTVEEQHGRPRGPSTEDRDAIEALHREFHGRLVRLCARQLGDHSLAEDVAQETVLRALRFWASYDAQRPTWPWLRAIALRLCIDAHRARSREVCLDEVPERSETWDRTEALLDEITVRHAMADLPERQRLALRLRYLDDRDRVDSARVLGVNVNAFDQLLSRARLRLSTVMGPAAVGVPLAVFRAMRGLVRKLPRRPRTGLASAGLGAMTTLSLGVVPLLTIVGALDLSPHGRSAPTAHVAVTFGASVRPVARSVPQPARIAPKPAAPTRASRAIPAPAGNVSVLEHAGPATAEAVISPHPLGRGRVAHHRIRITTPVVVVTVGGDDDRSPEPGLVCDLPTVTCLR